MRLSMDGKATVNSGEYSRGGKTRGDNRATDHDMGCEEKHTPFGVVNEDSDPFLCASEARRRPAISSSTISTRGGSVKPPRSELASHT